MQWMIVGIVLISSTTGFATEKKHSNPRSVIEAYLAAALAGKVDDAVSLGLEGGQASDKLMVRAVKEIIDAPTFKVQTVWVSVQNGQAIAVGEEITKKNRIGGDIGCLVFTLVRSQEVWLVDDIDCNTEVEANERVEEFKKGSLDAESLPVAVLAPNVGAEAATTLLRVTGGKIEIAMTPEHAKAMRERGESVGGMLVNCKSLKLTVNDEGKTFECAGCSFTTSTGIEGKAQLAVFDLAKGTVTLSGDDTSPVELLTNLMGQHAEQKLVAKSIEMSLLPDKPRLVGKPVKPGSKFFEAAPLQSSPL